MKTGDLVVATRKENYNKDDYPNRYMGIFIKENHDDKYIECFTGDRKIGRAHV